MLFSAVNIKQNISTMTFIKDFNHGNFDIVKISLIYFRQIVRSTKCLLGKKSV
jgi:hypothetical protein